MGHAESVRHARMHSQRPALSGASPAAWPPMGATTHSIAGPCPGGQNSGGGGPNVCGAPALRCSDVLFSGSHLRPGAQWRRNHPAMRILSLGSVMRIEYMPLAVTILFGTGRTTRRMSKPNGTSEHFATTTQKEDAPSYSSESSPWPRSHFPRSRTQARVDRHRRARQHYQKPGRRGIALPA
jgi:hypothetical protein